LSRLIVLDSGPLGLITNPRASLENDRCKIWLKDISGRGVIVALPEIVDYETRRELLRADKAEGLARLDELKQAVLYIPITTATMLLAAEFWAQIRKQGRQTAGDKALDGDVILAAQANLLGHAGDEVIVATTNVAHLARLCTARQWQDII
jgi:predicted nucleic acid-binding protein